MGDLYSGRFSDSIIVQVSSSLALEWRKAIQLLMSNPGFRRSPVVCLGDNVLVCQPISLDILKMVVKISQLVEQTLPNRLHDQSGTRSILQSKDRCRERSLVGAPLSLLELIGL